MKTFYGLPTVKSDWCDTCEAETEHVLHELSVMRAQGGGYTSHYSCSDCDERGC